MEATRLSRHTRNRRPCILNLHKKFRSPLRRVQQLRARSEGGAEGAPALPPAEQKRPQFEQPFLPDG